MKERTKKLVVLLLTAIMVISSTPINTYADSTSFSINVDQITKTSAKVNVAGATSGSTIAYQIAPSGAIDSVTGNITGLQPGTTYTVSATETISGTVTNTYDIYLKLSGYHYFDGTNEIRIYPFIDGSLSINWKEHKTFLGTFYTPESINITTSTTTTNIATPVEFTTLPQYTLAINVGNGGILVDSNNQIYQPGTTVINVEKEQIFAYKTYANAGFNGGTSGSYDVLGIANESVSVSFSTESDVYNLPFYNHHGFFSGLNGDGTSISGHTPWDDVLSASMTADSDLDAYPLNALAVITLDIEVANGDGTDLKLVEVDFYQEGTDKQYYDEVTSDTLVTFEYQIPATEEALVLDGFTLMGTENNNKVYQKILNYDLSDLYATTGGAAIIATAETPIIVHVPVLKSAPVVTSTFTNGINIVSGGTHNHTLTITDADEIFNTTLYHYYDSESTHFTNSKVNITGNVATVLNSFTPTTSRFAPGAHTITFYAIDADGLKGEEVTFEYILSEENEEETTGETNPPTETTNPPAPEPIVTGPQGTVTVSYVDQDGNSLAPSFSFTGTIGTNYATAARSFEGYTLIETPANATGSFTEAGVSISYEYSNDSLVIEEEEVALGDANEEVTTEATTSPSEASSEVVLDEATPLGDALPKTGQVSPELFYGLGGLISAAGIYLKRKK